MNKENTCFKKNTSVGQHKFLGALLAIVFTVGVLPVMATIHQRTGIHAATTDPKTIPIVSGNTVAPVVIDGRDFEVVKVAADLFAADVQRVTGKRPVTTENITASTIILAGTIGRNHWIDQMIASGKLKVDQIKGHWEATLSQIIDRPFPGVERAYVIAGSDRRGTAYGLMQLSQEIGVSPWYWWSDVAVRRRNALSVAASIMAANEPAVKYRGIFINDEDWGLNQWAKKTFDTDLKNMGPKTYAKVFELMLRLRLNYIWPAMHECSTEFSAIPENAALADKYGIIAGSSHCEPMLCNNINWDEKKSGPWNYNLNRDTIYNYWKQNTQTRSSYEAVWTMGIRGIHDQGMQQPPNGLPERIKLVSEVFGDQQKLINSYVSKDWGTVAKCFVPYKEVLPIYDAGLQVPEDVTLVWVDDNFGYLRRLSSPEERKRPGGAGVYWHLSYYGYPHSYTWLNTTPPALMWEELHKAWENDARKIWVINVGDIKPMEIGIDYFAQLAWNPGSRTIASQGSYLKQFVTAQFGQQRAVQISQLLMEFYRLGLIHKPEMMNRAWALSLSNSEAKQLETDYRKLLQDDQQIASALPTADKDAYVEMIGCPARILAASGLIFLADRAMLTGKNASFNQSETVRLIRLIENEVDAFNNKLASGKWKYMMPGMITGKDLTKWSSQVSWPWGEKEQVSDPGAKAAAERIWKPAASFDRQKNTGKAKWVEIEGLGASGRGLTLTPASISSSWQETDKNAPALIYSFQSRSKDDELWVDFLPTFRIYPGMKLRVAISIDDLPAVPVEVPGSNGLEDENGPSRNQGIRNNYVRSRVPLKGLTTGTHTLSIRAMDPGVVIDKISLP